MRYFGRDERAERYHRTRPRVHENVIRELVSDRLLVGAACALDVGCGTGHSTDALQVVSRDTIGLDVEPAMLHQAASSYSSSAFVRGDAERLPFRSGAFQLVTAGMAFHWFESGPFLREVARILSPGGRLLVYNLWFSAETQDPVDFELWFVREYLTRFPAPPRQTARLEKILATGSPLRTVGHRDFEFQVPFSAGSLRNYLTTQSNVEAAVRSGTPLAEIDRWLDDELQAFFPNGEIRKFAYCGSADLAVAPE